MAGWIDGTCWRSVRLKVREGEAVAIASSRLLNGKTFVTEEGSKW